MRYNSDLFDRETIVRLVGHLETLLRGLVASPDQRLSDLPLLSAEERQQLLETWNATQAPSAARGRPVPALAHSGLCRCIHHLLEAQAEQTPDAVAALQGDQAMTYRELNGRANQLAHYLRRLGVGPGRLVGLCLERSLDLLVGLWGILKAGGAFVPLDPANPLSRLALLLQDTQASVLLTQQSLAAAMQAARPDGVLHSIVCLDADWPIVARESCDNPVNSATPADLAYVIYTSGSTGQPKGVCLGHRGLCNLTEALRHYFRLPAGGRVLQGASWSFDGAIGELVLALGVGGTLCLGTREELQPGVPLLEFLRRQRINLACLPPSVWSAMPTEELPDLQIALAVGESCSAEVATRWGSGRRFINGYGPTETTIAATVYDCPADGRQPAIGRPIRNTRIYLLDRFLQPVPVGVPGELYIGGAGVAHGYLNRPELTAERFLPDPFCSEPGARLFRTGDLARYRPDGNLEFLGRLDQQVKVRGFRIELGEIEAVLRQFQQVQDAAVVVHQETFGQDRLAAYLAPLPGRDLSSTDWRSLLGDRLPGYMIPATFTVLDALPLAPSGKVDRKRLPAPAGQTLRRKGTFVAPRTPTEESLARIWADELGVSEVGVHDDFFALGGDSLTILRIVTRVGETLQVEMPLSQFFHQPTVAGLAGAIASASAGSASIDLDAEVVLDPAVVPASNRSRSGDPITSVFLTGGTGFLGAFLLRELLQQTQADIFCLVRATDASAGAAKLKQALEAYDLWDDSFRSRIVPVPGDLSRPLLGLPEEQFQILASKLDVIYHNGALVNLLYPYEALKSANVLGTQEVLRLACQSKCKPVHYVSTGSVFPLSVPGEDRLIREDEELRSEGLLGGYSQSKWVAEKLMLAARARGLPVAIYRPGQITGHSQTGVASGEDFLLRLIRICSRLGGVPDLDMPIDLTPVDYVSQAMVYLSLQEESLGAVFHLLNPRPATLGQLADLVGALGYPLRRVPYHRWQAELLALGGPEAEKALAALLPLYAGSTSENGTAEMPPRRLPRLDCQNTLIGLARSSISCPPIDEGLLGTYLESFVRDGLLEGPQTEAIQAQG